MNQYPLHRISYCADDKAEKKFFSFIAKEQDSEHHVCFVFVSDKLAEEITLTIGQAFDLAYRRFIETSGKDLETQRHLMVLQQKLKCLENENSILRQRLSDVSKIKGTADVEEYMARNKITNLLTVTQPTTGKDSDSASLHNNFGSDANTNGSGNGTTQYGQLVSLGSPLQNGASPPPVPPRVFENNKPFDDDFLKENNTSNQPIVGTKLEGLLLDDLEDDFNPRAYEGQNQTATNVANSTSPTNLFNGNSPPSLSPPPKQVTTGSTTTSRPRPHATNGHTTVGGDLFLNGPFLKQNSMTTTTGGSRGISGADLFGMDDFTSATSPNPSQQDLENAIGILDKRILEMKAKREDTTGPTSEVGPDFFVSEDNVSSREEVVDLGEGILEELDVGKETEELNLIREVPEKIVKKKEEEEGSAVWSQQQ
ncbi:hypothetical protein RUM43_011908 [Polyplax serrata]|uniref:PID domain-containing protein n=1 Tax=Polyplax serrata TaxID=468196 RepID=A0AAN8P1R1_POLSC